MNILKRLTKAKLREEGVSFGSSDQADLEERLASVLGVIYLIFTEGPADELINDDAIRKAYLGV